VGLTALALPDIPTASLRELVSTRHAPALNSKPRESFAGSQGAKEDDDGVSLSRCHACGEELALFSCDDCLSRTVCATRAQGPLTASAVEFELRGCVHVANIAAVVQSAAGRSMKVFIL
jgi:hypothetical protein